MFKKNIGIIWDLKSKLYYNQTRVAIFIYKIKSSLLPDYSILN